ncbi:arginine--tRNA ligase [Candidatus Uhrbacteria bacterium]|nr:arginine--tRNA ligase [Candidatus Uhrbacteria bacterium]
MDNLRFEIESAIGRAFGSGVSAVPELEVPPDIKFGDFAISCFSLAKKLGKNPMQVAQALTESLNSDVSGVLVRATAVGPYVNLALADRALFESAFSSAHPEAVGVRGQVMVEYLSPNTNKPLHLGHVRNGCLGAATSNLLEHSGFRVIRAELINDRGIHIMKSLLAWQKFGNGETPQSTGEKGDHFVGRYYVRYSQEEAKDPSLKGQAQDLLRRWEGGDAEIVALWKRMNQWVYGGFEETCRRFGFGFDKVDLESDTYRLGKSIVEDGLKRGVFVRADDGSICFPLSADEFGTNEDGSPKRLTLLRSDGTSVYVTQDLGTADLRFRTHGLDRLIHVVGSEQVYHFRTLKAVLKALGRGDWADAIHHLSYGMVLLPDGKMKSREGKVVDADDLLDGMSDMAAQAIAEKHGSDSLEAEEIRRRAEVIGLGSIKFHLLKCGATQEIRFNPKESLSFDGMTGPYCQYAYARIASILARARAESLDWGQADPGLLGKNSEERLLAQNLLLFNRKAFEAAESLNPAVFLAHVYDLAKAFNQFYHRHQVLGSGDDRELTKARLAMLSAVQEALKSGLGLLGIGVLETM